MTWGTGYEVFELEMLKIHVLLKCTKVWFSAIDGVRQNSVLKISFIRRVQATGLWILELDKFHVFLAKYLNSTGSLDE